MLVIYNNAMQCLHAWLKFIRDDMHNGLAGGVTIWQYHITVTLEALVHQAIEEGAAVVAEGGAGVGVGAELVHPGLTAPIVLGKQNLWLRASKQTKHKNRITQMGVLNECQCKPAVGNSHSHWTKIKFSPLAGKAGQTFARIWRM